MLTLRKQRILQAVVDEYVKTPVPVSSHGVVNRLPVSVSPATVRNDMAELEEDGYLMRPHASAGGVPSDKGYRAYIGFLGAIPEPSPHVKRSIRLRFEQGHMDVEAWSRMASQLLAGVAHTMAICTPPRAPEARWKQLNLVQVQEFLALLVMVLRESRLRQQLLPLKEPVTQEQLTQVANKLNVVFSSLSRSEIRAKNVELTPLESDITGVALALLSEYQRDKFPDYYVDGLRHLFSQAEMTPPSRAREIAELLEDRQVMQSVLGEAPEAGEVRVAIGSENRPEALHSFSIVLAQYGVPSEASGMVGIMGPTRMEYSTAISSVRYLASVMGDMLEMVQGRASN